MKMYEGKLISTCWTSVLLIATMGTSWVKAAETRNYGGMLAPNVPSSQGCTTSGPADSLFYLIDFNIPYGFVVVEALVPLIFVGRVYYQGQSGLGATLEVEHVIGFASMVNYQVYFFVTEGCPNVIPVQNSNATVYGYRNLYGSLLYQVFAALRLNCTYYCSTCPTAELNDDPSQIAAGQGRAGVVMRNIQSFTVASSNSASVPSLMQKLNSRLSANSVQSYVLQASGQCVNVNKQYPFLASCPLATKILTSANVRNSITSRPFMQKNQFCSIVISQALQLTGKSQPIFGVYRYFFPTFYNTLSIVSCVSTFQVFEAVFEAFFQFCG